MKINNSKISDHAWGDVDKTKLANDLKDNGSIAILNEAYLYIGDKDKVSTYKFPHHNVEDDELVVNKGGVHAAAQRLVSSGDTATDIPKSKAARHLLKHYKAMDEDPPESLTKLSKSYPDLVQHDEKSMEDIIKDKRLNVKVSEKGLLIKRMDMDI